MTRKEKTNLLQELGKAHKKNQIKKINSLTGKLEKNLNFKDEQQLQQWLSVLFTFKCWEDFEELTQRIIKQNKKVKYWTLAQFYKEEKELKKNGESEKAISKHRKIWDLASKGWTLSKVGEDRKQLAAQLLKEVYHEWKCKDNALEWDQYDNDHARRMRQHWDKKDDESIEKLKNLCKTLGLTLEMSTFAHVAANTKNGRREIL